MKPTRVLALFVLTLLALAAAWVLLGDDDPGAAPRPGAPDLAARARDAADLPAGPASAADPVALDADPPSVGSHAPAARAAPAATTAAQPGRAQVLLVGRVVDPAGRAVPDAEVCFLASGLDAVASLVAREADATPEQDAATAAASAPGAGSDGAPRAATDAEGRFELEVPVPERDPEMAAVAWMLSSAAQLVATSRGLATTSHACPPLAPGRVDVGTIVMDPGAWITGRAVDEHGLPVAGASVTARNASSGTDALGALFEQILDPTALLGEVRTGPDGSFEVAGLRPGRALLALVRPGRQPARVDGLELAPYAGTDVGAVVLPAGVSIAGIVTDADGTPLAGATVEADADAALALAEASVPLAMLQRLLPRTRTDASGRFALDGLRAGEHAVRAALDGFVAARRDGVATGTRDVHLVLERPVELLVQVVADGTAEPVTDATITARARDADGAPSDELEVRAPPQAGAPHRVAGVGPHGALLALRAPGFGAARVGTDELPVAAGGARVVTLAPEAVVFGFVVDDGDVPLPGAEVRLVPAGERDAGAPGVFMSRTEVGGGRGRIVRREGGDDAAGPAIAPAAVRADETGAFRIAGLCAGTWRLRAEAAGHVATSVAVEQLGQGEERGPLRVALPAAGSLAGTVTEAGGEPVADALVVVAPGSLPALPSLEEGGFAALAAVTALGSSLEERMASIERATTDASGAWRVDDLAPGTYTVTMRPPGMSVGSLLAFTGLDAAGGAAGEAREVAVAPREETRVDFVRAARAVVEGRVLAAGQPVPSARVRLLDRTTLFGVEIPFAARTVLADRGGRFRLEDVEAGRYALSAAVAGAPLEKEVELELTPGERVTRDLVFGSARVRGTVVDADGGAPLPGVAVRIAPADAGGGNLLGGLFGDGIQLRVNVDVDGRRQQGGGEVDAAGSVVHTDAEGRFELAFLDAGTYAVSTEPGAFTAARLDDIELTDGATRDDVRLAVRRAATLTGRVTSKADGAPVPLQRVRVTGPGGEREETQTDGEGRWTIAGLVPGEHRVTLPSGGFFGGNKAAADVSLAAGETRTLDLAVAE